MTRTFFLIFCLLFFGCKTNPIHEKWSELTLFDIVKNKKTFLQSFIRVDNRAFNFEARDTLFVNFTSSHFCANEPIERIDGSPLFDYVKTKAINFGFKTVINDTSNVWDFDESQSRYIPHYSLEIIAEQDNATITQTYYFYSRDNKFIGATMDTTITLKTPDRAYH